jgi:esterase/lipase superfamily enzyme
MTPNIVANAIVAALSAGAVAGVTDTVKSAIGDAYQSLKSLIRTKFGHDSNVIEAIDRLEAGPDSADKKEVLAEELNAVNSASDPELVSAALSLLALITALPQGEKDIQFAQGTGIAQADRGSTATVVMSAERNELFKIVESLLPATRMLETRVGSPVLKPSEPSPHATLVQVFYATDRMKVADLTGCVEYGVERSLNGNLHYGRCEVSIPKLHKIGKLETPSILRLEFRPNPKRHIILSNTYSLEEDAFFELLKSSVAKSASKDAFFFVHGYNVSFEDAARRTGQMGYDLSFVGAPIFYSWPSNGKTADYLKDETNITWSTPHLEKFLGLLAQKSGAGRIHVIAHSMGNRGVCDALKALSYDRTSQLRFTHLVLAAPDIDADTFQELASTLQRLSGRVTLYESSQDKAIWASKKIHGNPRAGEPLLVVAGMDTIDASAIDTDFLGHSYFSDNWPLLSDIHSILFKDEPPSGRFGLVEMEHEDGKYYAFKR